MSDAKKLKDAYINWISDEFVFTDVNDGYISISTPFIDSMYDNIELFAKLENDKLYLTDLGETIFNLESQGINFSARFKNNNKLLNLTLSDFNVLKNDHDELFIETSVDNFGDAKIRLLQTIMRLNDIPYLVKHNHSIPFNQTVEKLLIDEDIPYFSNFTIPTHLFHAKFDFAIPKTKDTKPKCVRTIATPNSTMQAKAFSYDVQEIQATGRKDTFILLADTKSKPEKLKDVQAITSELKNTEVLDLSNPKETLAALTA